MSATSSSQNQGILMLRMRKSFIFIPQVVHGSPTLFPSVPDHWGKEGRAALGPDGSSPRMWRFQSQGAVCCSLLGAPHGN